MKHLIKFEYYDTTGMEPVSNKELKHLTKNVGQNHKVMLDLKSRLNNNDKIQYNDSLEEIIYSQLPILKKFHINKSEKFIVFNYEKEILNKTYVINLDFDINNKLKKVKINLEFYINDTDFGIEDVGDDDVFSAMSDEKLGSDVMEDAEYLEKLILYKIVDIDELNHYFSLINAKIDNFVEYANSKYGAELF